jgi:hypothetical protein
MFYSRTTTDNSTSIQHAESLTERATTRRKEDTLAIPPHGRVASGLLDGGSRGIHAPEQSLE